MQSSKRNSGKPLDPVLPMPLSQRADRLLQQLILLALEVILLVLLIQAACR